MGERRFFITEIPPLDTLGWRLQLTSITESELKRRLEAAIGFVEEEEDFVPTKLTDIGFQGVLKILLHGTEKAVNLSPEEAAQFEQQIGAQKAMDRLKPVEERDTTNYDEWEEWVERFPNPGSHLIGDEIAWHSWHGLVKDWFRQQPRR